ncbi:hypothetical protein BDN71DRAFT_1479677 [Pleurotus eryngii]|uniref:Mitochondrial adapter protein MCP1 transmembrane domain-containing protein n=1 Tax=Pleurotus eryngii TaxID=5323 RepID=A0A9P6A7N3_PLEER|nr:hypothetical protein BDN71DRAFT_1479677 [Pleurotus eryngii]
MPPDRRTQSFRDWSVSGLTKISYISSPFIATFLLIHLSAPTMACLGGPSLSSQTMILGREYYQTPFGEKYLVLGPIAVHALSGLFKRLLSKKSPRPARSLLSMTGYSIMILFLPIHFFTHRLHPTSPLDPIHSVGPAELDFEFVKLGLQKWPFVSWGLYVGLLLSIGLHLADGANIIWNSRLKESLGRPRRWRIQSLAMLAFPPLIGLWFLANEPSLVLSSTARRFEAAFRENWLYRIL